MMMNVILTRAFINALCTVYFSLQSSHTVLARVAGKTHPIAGPNRKNAKRKRPLNTQHTPLGPHMVMRARGLLSPLRIDSPAVQRQRRGARCNGAARGVVGGGGGAAARALPISSVWITIGFRKMHWLVGKEVTPEKAILVVLLDENLRAVALPPVRAGLLAD